MNRLNIISVLLSTLLFVGYLLVLHVSKHVPPHSQLFVVCTTTLLADAVHQIAHDKVATRTLMGPGVDPHVYQARESDIHALVQADIIFYHGLHLEGKLSHLLSSLTTPRTVAVSKVISTDSLITTDVPSVYDPHLWHDVKLWKEVVQHIATELQKIDPDNASYYHVNTQNYLDELEHLDIELKRLIDQVDPSRRVLITAHDAFSYFGKAYGFTVIGLQGINTQTEISLKDISNLVTIILQHKVPTIFLETSTPVRTIQAVQHATGQHNWTLSIGPELYSDSLDNPDKPTGSYVGMMKHNVQTIVEHLK